uniref:G_PROTEIN_RECEP_F1_2 domain-containing protein n=1 Tax=Macrostomum lignano TaxID=282301 RepID=A0A1I8F480_9PLAT
GWVVLQFELERVEINQCRNESTFRSLYANNVCAIRAQRSACTSPDQGLSDTNFYCKCRRYFHHGNFSGEQVRMQYLLHRKGSASNYSSLECGPCPAECPGSCATNGDCLIKHDLDILRALPLVIQTFLMTGSSLRLSIRRKAHDDARTPIGDLLKYLAGIVAVAVGFMAAWTAATLDHSRRLHGTLRACNCSSADQLSASADFSDGGAASTSSADRTHPDYVYLMYFARCHLTCYVTAAALVICAKAELKRLYTQLEIFKTKVMRKENPHISKRKGGRKQTHRR